ncbi:MAG: DUF3737 family protein [Clostridia bacterium]|nr:DUF3737 family protein [Clostridia bacterium]
MSIITNRHFTEERALFGERNTEVSDSLFETGESPFKHGADLTLSRVTVRSKYPLWYVKGVSAEEILLEETARAGVWYTEDVRIRSSRILAPKTFRRCSNLILEDLDIPLAEETLWACDGIRLSDVRLQSADYFAMNSRNIVAENLELQGKYAFDGAKNVTIRNARLLTKDAFWNSENVTVSDSYIESEYLGWNSRNLSFTNCVLKSLQGFCYIDSLALERCDLGETSLAFEYSTVDADCSEIKSVFNPAGGTIRAERIGKLILQKERVDASRIRVECPRIDAVADEPDFSE